jgi:hypothetical protein
MKAKDRQVGGTHYRDMAVQPWDAMHSWLGGEGFIGYLRGSAINYLARAGAKGPMREDVKKARHCLDRLIEELEFDGR